MILSFGKLMDRPFNGMGPMSWVSGGGWWYVFDTDMITQSDLRIWTCQNGRTDGLNGDTRGAGNLLILPDFNCCLVWRTSPTKEGFLNVAWYDAQVLRNRKCLLGGNSTRNKKCSTKNKGDKLIKTRGKSIVLLHERDYIFILLVVKESHKEIWENISTK